MFFAKIFRLFLLFLHLYPVNQSIFIVMPVQKVPGGYRWGQTGKIYPTKAQAEAQGRAIYASGYREKPAQNKKK